MRGGVRGAGVLALCALLLRAGSAIAEPGVSLTSPSQSALIEPDVTRPVQLLSPSVVETDGGSHLRVPPGWFLADEVWQRLDAETRRLQDAETRLTAENRSFRASSATWGPSWWIIVAAVAGGASLGWYARGKL